MSEKLIIKLEHKFKYVIKTLGTEGAKILQVDSPFDYNKNSLLLIPKDMPNNRGGKVEFLKHRTSFVENTVKLIDASNGNSMVLFYKKDDLKYFANQLEKKLDSKYEILIQDTLSRSELINKFTNKDDVPKVLLGSKTFWQGINVPGEQLTLVIIDKIPFIPIYNPILRTKIKKSNYDDFDLNQTYPAAMQLKQAVGRLIRTKIDKGVVMIYDYGLIDESKSYGKKIIKSLQPMKFTHNINDAIKFLKEINND